MEKYPPVEPYEQGMLDVGDGQQVYWEVCGNPAGRPALFLHGGPGWGCTAGSRRLFDPVKYRAVIFDQRNCGRSTPSAGDSATVLSANTTSHLIGDIERLREHLRVDAWVVFGASWGVTLGLAYAEQHPERVAAAIFASVTMTRPADVHWLYHEVGRYFPEEWDVFRRGVTEPGQGGDLVAAYDRLLNGAADLAVRERAAQQWCDWEAAVLSLEPGFTYPERFADPHFRLTFARIVAHYFRHAAWLADGQLLRNAHKLAGIPAVLVHGRLDSSAGPPTPRGSSPAPGRAPSSTSSGPGTVEGKRWSSGSATPWCASPPAEAWAVGAPRSRLRASWPSTTGSQARLR